ncbi:MAG: energy transducer TonB [Acidobacteriota bacterium]
MASIVTTEFVRNIHADAPPFSLIEQEGLVSRLIRELEGAVGELTRDPRSFIRDLFTADTKDAKRRQRIYVGLTCAAVVHVVLLTLIAVLGWQAMFVKRVDQKAHDYTVIFPELQSLSHKTEPTQSEVAKGEAGGGGGGQHTQLPPSKGEPPPMLPLPQIVSMNPSKIPEPSLPISPTVVGPESPPPPPAPVGDPTGKRGEFSGGPGADGGIGRGAGTGVGGGKDPGVGAGSKGGRNGGPAGLREGSGGNVPPVIDFNRINSLPGYKTWSWIRRWTATVTPEAQENKVIGTVVLRATFNADGTISDIEVAMPVDFMTESAIEALRRSTFHPATINGVPITVRKVLIKIYVHY